LQGFELASGAWEEALLPARVANYRAEWLDDLCLSGEVVWGRLGLRSEPEAGAGTRSATVPSRATPIAFACRGDLDWLLCAVRGDIAAQPPPAGPARQVYDALCERGALFLGEIVGAAGLLPVQVEEGLWELVSRGVVTADGFESVRALLGARRRHARARASQRRRLRRGAQRGQGREGRWALLTRSAEPVRSDELAEAVAEQLLARWGVVFRDLLLRESFEVPWREVLWALRRLEDRGVVRGGRFVTGFTGEQYALPGAVEALRATRRLERKGEIVRLCAADPLNLVGVLTPGPRVPAIRSRSVTYRDGLPIEEAAVPGVRVG
jgi:ATP-dependent Lhr-like helicase